MRSIDRTTRARRWGAAAVLAVLVGTALAAPLPGSTDAEAAVPQPVPGTSVVTVKTGSDRQSTAEVTPLPGVVLQLRYSNAVGADLGAIPAGWATCVADDEGDCSFTVPDTGDRGANEGAYFLVVQTGAPPGYAVNPALGTGTAGNISESTYRFRTPPMQAGTIYSSTGASGTTPFMVSDLNTGRSSGGVWQSSRDNPPPPEQCGIDVALVTDLSGSVAPEIAGLRSAATTFVDALTGTPSTVGVYTFATAAPANTSNNANIPRTAVSSATNAAELVARINGFTASGATNWDQGINQVVPDAAQYDLAIVLTDGNPTTWGNNQGNGSTTRFREVERGIFAANALKAAGPRVIAFGVGDGLTQAGSVRNLSAISGPDEGSDYFRTEDYAEAGQQLREIALAGCTPSVSVTKQVVPPGTPEGSVEGAQLRPGWTFDAEFGGEADAEGPTTLVTDETGSVNFQLGFPGGEGEGTATITETLEEGYEPHPVGGQNAVCVDIAEAGPPDPVDVTSSDDGTAFTVDVDGDAVITCTVYNVSPFPPASVTVTKEWMVNGVPYPQGEQPKELVARPVVDGAPVAWGSTTEGFQQDDVVTIDESVTLPRLCKLTGSTVTPASGSGTQAPGSDFVLDEGDNAFLVTNVVECATRLTLTKAVRGGPALPDAWALDAQAPEGALPGPAGTTGVTADVTPQALYTLTESGGDPRYVPWVAESATLLPGASGSWICAEVGPRGVPVGGFADGLDGGVQVHLGTHVDCTAYNDTVALTLRKVVDPALGGTLVPEDWTITATPTGPDLPDGLGPETVTGSSDGVTIQVRPGTDYVLTEDGPDGYELVDQTCTVTGGGDVDLVVRALDVDPLDVVDCTLTNRGVGATLTLVKQVVNDDGGTATPRSWTLVADGPTPVQGATGSPEVTAVTVAAGTYVLAERGGPDGYAAGAWSCVDDSGEPVELDDSTLTLSLGDAVLCAVVNDDVAPPGPTPTPGAPPSSGPVVHGAGPASWLADTGFTAGHLVGLAALLLAAGAVAIGVRRRTRRT